MTDLAISTLGLTKRFGSQVVVDDLALAVPRGAVYGFLGPNGSGKTTTIRMVLGLVGASGGESRLLGHPMPAGAGRALPLVGALVEGPAFHPYLSGRSNLLRLDAADRYASGRTARPRVETALERVGLGPAATKRYRAYSLGMRQRLALAAALLSPRELLVLDEPTNGLDPQGTREVRHLIAELAAAGVTVFVSSHLLGEIDQTCSHLGIMRAGRLVAQGTIDEIHSGTDRVLRLETPDPQRARAVLERHGVTSIVTDRSGLRGIQGGAPPEQLVAALVGEGVAVRGFAVTTASLEDRYVALTGEGFDVSG